MSVRVRTYLALAFIIAAVMPLAIFWSWPYSRILEEQKADVRERHLLIAEHIASALAEYHRDLETLFAAQSSLIAAGGGQDARPIFRNLRFDHVCVADAQTGSVSLEYPVSDAACPATLPAERLAQFSALAAGERVGVSKVHRSPGEPARIYIATRAGPQLVIGAVRTDYFRQLRAQVAFGQHGHAAIIDQDGQAIAHPFEEKSDQAIDLSSAAPVRRLMNGETGVDVFYSPLRQEQMIAGFAPVEGTGWGVIVPQPLSELHDYALGFNRDALLVLSVGVGFSLALAFVVSWQVSRRLGGIADAIQDVGQAEDVRVSTHRHLIGIRELETLEADINRLAGDIASARRDQQNYNRDLELANSNLRREVEDRLSAEAARQSSEVRFRSLFESAPIPIREEDLSGMKRMIDDLGIPDREAFGAYLEAHPEFLEACSKEIVVVDANRASLAQHGYGDKSEMLARVVRTLSPAAKRIVRMTAEALHSGASGRSYETQITRTDGEVRIVAARWSVIPGYEETYERILLCSIDLTDRLKSEETLRQAQKMDAVGQLTGGVAHDFNNLLTVISGNIELMEETAELDAELAAPIKKAVRRGAELTQRLLAFSRKQPLSPQAIDLGELIGGMSDLLRRSLGDEIAIEIEIDHPLWMALADPGQVEAALLNMALNSRDAMVDGGLLTISSRNAVIGPDNTDDLVPGEYVVLCVSDTGTGMTAEVRSRAYEPFFTTKEIGKGTGLGLSSVYGFAKQSGGDVRIESQPGIGSKVSLFLPRTGEAISLPGSAPRLSTTVNGHGQTVLVVEDDADVLRFLEQMLDLLQYRVLTAGDIAEARRVMQSEQAIDLLISDVMLPGGVRGPQFAAELVERFPRAGVILISGRPERANIDAIPALANAKVLGKPFTREALIETIEVVSRSERCSQSLPTGGLG